MQYNSNINLIRKFISKRENNLNIRVFTVAICLPVPLFLDSLIYTPLKTIGTIYTTCIFSFVGIHTCAIYIFKYTHVRFFHFQYTHARIILF